MLKKGALAIALAGYVLAGTTAASAGQRASAAAFPVAKGPVQAIGAPAKRRVAKDAEFAAGGLVLPLVIGGLAVLSLVVVVASGGNDSSPN